MKLAPLNLAYVVIRAVAFLCIVAAILSAFAGARIAGLLLLSAFGLIGVGAALNVYFGLAAGRLFLAAREITKQSQPALFRLWFFLNAFLALTIGVAAVFILLSRAI